jgi:hypothetical protein
MIQVLTPTSKAVEYIQGGRKGAGFEKVPGLFSEGHEGHNKPGTFSEHLFSEFLNGQMERSEVPIVEA